MDDKLEECELCPWKCKVNRINGQKGRCRAGKEVKIALVSVHAYEEPCISGTNGSGTIFFSNCNLSCIYCQNNKISSGGFGKEITIERLADILNEQQKRGVHNVNLVSPTIYVPQIKEALTLAKQKGFSLPVVYNSSGYERKETIQALKGYIDIYLPDFKYMEDDLGETYSRSKRIFKICKRKLVRNGRTSRRAKV